MCYEMTTGAMKWLLVRWNVTGALEATNLYNKIWILFCFLHSAAIVLLVVY